MIRAARFLVIAFLASGCAPTNHAVILKNLSVQLAQQYHECVPVGWDPVPVLAGVFYPGYSAEYIPPVQWLPPRWIGTVEVRNLSIPEIRASYNVLNALVRADMLERTPIRGGFRYNLTMKALDYYWEGDPYRTNPGGQPYLCYSAIIPQRILWNQPIHQEKDQDGRTIQVFRAAFVWRASPDADWANDPFLRSHSVILPPTESPTIAKFVNIGGDWYVRNIYAQTLGLPRVVDASVWPPFRHKVASAP